MKSDFLTSLIERVGRMGLPTLKIYRFFIDFKYSKRDKEINDWFDKKKVFFIVSTGRTATKWLSHLLNQIDGYLVTHEPVPEEAKAHRIACENPESTIPYIMFRKREIYSRCRSLPGLYGYGEVNGNLRRHILSISKIFPGAAIIHLVRDGRDVVRSVLSRTAFTEKHSVYNETFIQPTYELTAEAWLQLSRFEKFCWVWKAENEFIRKNTFFHTRIEDITSSYALFKEQILEPLGLELEEDIWRVSLQHPKNVTKEYAIGSWDDWTAEQQKQFIRICSKEMQEYGYEI